MHRPKKFDPPWIDFFHSPCPYYIAQHTTFPKFSLLPKEIQHMIWEFTRPEARAVYAAVEIGSLVDDDGVAKLTRTLYLGTAPPAILGTSFDSRTAALKLYTPVLGAIFLPAGMTRPVYFDLERDYLQINFPFFDVAKRTFRKAPKEQNDLPLIRNLVLELKITPFRDLHLITICRYFSGLKRLYIIEPDFSTTTHGIPHTFQPDEKSFRHDWKKLRRAIKAPIPFVREKLENWTPPALTVGTRSEWQFRGQHIRERMDFCDKFQRTARGEMEGVQLTATYPSLDFVPMYQVLKPELTSSLTIDPVPIAVQDYTNEDVAVANYFRNQIK